MKRSILVLSLVSVCACSNDSPCDDKDIYPGAYAVFYEETSGDCGSLGQGRLHVDTPTNLPVPTQECVISEQYVNDCSTEQAYTCSYSGVIDAEPAEMTASYECTYEYEMQEDHKFPQSGACTISVAISMSGVQVFTCTSDYSVAFLRYTVMY